jgi:hypothetical protein
VINLFGRVAFPDLAEKEVTAVVLKAKKLGKTQKYGVGDVFAIPLRDGYRFGRIIKPTAAGQLVEIYDLHSDRLLAFAQIANKDKKVATWKHVHGILAFHNRRWPILGHEAIPKDYAYPCFYQGSGFTGFLLVRGEEEGSADASDIAHAEPMIMFAPQDVEARLLANMSDPWPEVRESRDKDIREANETSAEEGGDVADSDEATKRTEGRKRGKR